MTVVCDCSHSRSCCFTSFMLGMCFPRPNSIYFCGFLCGLSLGLLLLFLLGFDLRSEAVNFALSKVAKGRLLCSTFSIEPALYLCQLQERIGGLGVLAVGGKALRWLIEVACNSFLGPARIAPNFR